MHTVHCTGYSKKQDTGWVTQNKVTQIGDWSFTSPQRSYLMNPQTSNGPISSQTSSHIISIKTCNRTISPQTSSHSISPQIYSCSLRPQKVSHIISPQTSSRTISPQTSRLDIMFTHLAIILAINQTINDSRYNIKHIVNYQT